MTKEEGYQIALDKIAENQQAQVSFLDLSYLGLTQLPKEITELKHLQTLNLRANKLQDVSVLQYLDNLRTLDLSDNEIYDAETIQEIVQGFEEIRDILQTIEPTNKTFQRFAQEVENIVNKYQKYGYFEYYGLKDYIQIIQNPKFGKVFIDGIDTKYNLNSGFVKAAGFIVSTDYLKKIIPFQIKPIPNLQSLTLAQNPIGNPTFVLIFPQLKRLDLQSNKINPDWLPQLNQLACLESLNISSIGLPKIELYNFPNLIELIIKSYSTKSISLSEFPKIKSLDLSNLQIENIYLEDFDSLEELNLNDNDIKDVSSLLNLKNLKNLNLNKNRIDSIEQIEQLISLPNLLELRIYGNPINKTIDIEFLNVDPRTNDLEYLKEYFQDN